MDLHQRRLARPATPAVAHDERHDERDQEKEEQHLGDAGRGAREAGKAEDGREDGDDEQSNRRVKHKTARQRTTIRPVKSTCRDYETVDPTLSDQMTGRDST